MELRQFGEKLDLDNRTVRYVMEQKLVAGLDIRPGRGARRTLTKSQAKKVALAAILHGLGLRSDAVRKAVRDSAGPLSREVDPLVVNLASTAGKFYGYVGVDMHKVYEVLK